MSPMPHALLHPHLRAVAGVLLALSLSACGSPDGGSTAAPGGGSPAASSPPPESPVSSTPGGPADDGTGVEVVEPQPGMVDVRPIRFDKAKATDDDTIRVTFWSGVEPCSVLDHVDVEETPDEVSVTLFEGRDPNAGEDVACIEIALKKAVDIDLEAPLGDRKITDGSK